MPRMPAARGYSAGFATIQAPDRVRVPQGPSVGEGIARFGQVLGEIGADMGRREDAANQQAQDIAAREAEKRDRAFEIERREAAAEQRRIDSINAGNAAVEYEIGLKAARVEVDDQLARGQITPEQYQSKMQEFASKRSGELRGGLSANAQIDFDRASLRPTRMAELDTIKALGANRKREAVAALDKAGEDLTRLAVTDLQTALARGAALYSRDGLYASQIGIDQAQKQGQAFKESATRAHFASAVTASQNNPRALADLRKQIGSNQDLDPNQQNALIGQIDSRTSVLENRVIAAQQRADRQRDQSLQALQTMVEQGLPIDPAYLDRTMLTLKGSPQAATAAALVKGSVETAGFGSMSVSEMDRQLEQMRKQGLDPTSSKLYQKRLSIRNAAESAYRTDPWRAASERGVIDTIAPLDTSSLSALSTSLVGRMVEATAVDMAAGRVVSPLRPDEASGLADTLNALPVQERTKMLGAVHQAIGPDRMRALAEQMKAKDTTLGTVAAAQALGLKTQGGLNLGEIVLRGADARKTGLVKDNDAIWRQVQDEVVKQLDGAFATPPATNAAVEAVMNVYAGMTADGRRPSASEAIVAATGGIMDYNGQKIQIPYGWDAARVRKSITEITPDWIRGQSPAQAYRVGPGGHLLGAEDIAHAVPRAQLRAAGYGGRYSIRIGENIVTDENGRPVTIGLPDID